MPNTEYLEATALGRAEWVKLLGVFLNEERSATATFAAVRDRYQALARRVASVPEDRRPRVIVGTSCRRAISISPAAVRMRPRSSRMPAAAIFGKATPKPAARRSTSRCRWQKARRPKVWLARGAWRTLGEMLADDPRYTAFEAFCRGNVWTHNRKVNAAGGNDYWVRGVTRPDLILADLIKIYPGVTINARSCRFGLPRVSVGIRPGRSPPAPLRLTRSIDRGHVGIRFRNTAGTSAHDSARATTHLALAFEEKLDPASICWIGDCHRAGVGQDPERLTGRVGIAWQERAWRPASIAALQFEQRLGRRLDLVVGCATVAKAKYQHRLIVGRLRPDIL